MKKIKFFAIALGIFALGAIGFGLTASVQKNNEPLIAFAEGEGGEEPPVVDPEEEKTGTVVIIKAEHGNIETDIADGKVGDIVTVTAKPSLCYLVGSVSVNGVALVEDSVTNGMFKFALAEGENKITASFVVDEQLLGVFSKMYGQAADKDWKSLFSVENVIVIVKWVLDGGVLILLARYYIKDKKLEHKVEQTVATNIQKIIPDVTKETVIATVKDFITPVFSQLEGEIINILDSMSVFSKVLALMQEGTPEAKLAIMEALQGLKVGDQVAIEKSKAYIADLVARTEKAYEETLKALEEIKERKVLSEVPVEKVEEPKPEEKSEDKTEEKETSVDYDGTQI